MAKICLSRKFSPDPYSFILADSNAFKKKPSLFFFWGGGQPIPLGYTIIVLQKLPDVWYIRRFLFPSFQVKARQSKGYKKLMNF